jgi:indole-3-glycerol phosphate synthase
MTTIDHLGLILERKRRENVRRRAHARLWSVTASTHSDAPSDRGALALQRLRRPTGGPVRVIAEVKFRSPSAGTIRTREPGVATNIAIQYEAAGASAVSVLCDGPGFGGGVLDLRRAARAIAAPILFKEFVLDPLQVELARAAGAHMVLLLVRALDPVGLREMVAFVLKQGMAPVVEASDDHELEVALATQATIIGVNARDLRTFRVNTEQAQRALMRIPDDKIAVHMSGITSGYDLARVSETSRADAVLVGEALMRAESPGDLLKEWIAAAHP